MSIASLNNELDNIIDVPGLPYAVLQAQGGEMAPVVFWATRLAQLDRLTTLCADVDVSDQFEAARFRERVGGYTIGCLLSLSGALLHCKSPSAARAVAAHVTDIEPYRYEAWELLLEALSLLNDRPALESAIVRIPPHMEAKREKQFALFLLGFCQQKGIACPSLVLQDAQAAVNDRGNPY